MLALLIVLVVVVGVQSGLARGQDLDSFEERFEESTKRFEESVERLERFQLYTGCSPLELSVFVAGDDAKAIGLTRDRLQAAAESRLRSARLHMSSETIPSTVTDLFWIPSLSVSARVAGSALVVLVELRKTLGDPATGVEGKAGTWRSGKFGTHGKDAGDIVQLVAEELDRFLVEYLRVNEKDCRDR